MSDDVLGHRKIRQSLHGAKVATGEQCQNRILFKQLIESDTIDIVQIDACRMGGLNEILTVCLLAAKYGKPVCPHAGGVGLCEYVQRISMIDYVQISADIGERVIEFVDHLHEHFEVPCAVVNGATAYCKLSGLITEAAPEQTDADIQPYFDHLLRLFGAERLLRGSDWPVLNLAGDYAGWHKTCRQWTAELSAAERGAIFGDNAIRFYGLTIC